MVDEPRTEGAGRLLTDRPELGDRVILAAAQCRSPEALGTVIESDPYPDRDVLVAVYHDDHKIRWHRRDSLRALGHRMSVDDLAADLEGLAAPREMANGG